MTSSVFLEAAWRGSIRLYVAYATPAVAMTTAARVAAPALARQPWVNPFAGQKPFTAYAERMRARA